MPIKPPNQSSKVREAPNSFTQKRLRDRKGEMKNFSQDSGRSPKGDMERPPKGDRIYNKPEFKQAVKKTEDDFSNRSFGILKRLDGSSVPRR